MSSCTKSETQYTDQNNKTETVNDKASDTIQTLNEVSDTANTTKDRTHVKTDNE
ncbi:hypothetical protein H9Q08_04930 [Chryseobacterium sp. PS-8]|uniref:Uncharacterized protein n=1 Tax=Chryseobacterium indicum TaxID=2766954 RepID=A0ABS9C5Q5_9FLAO|nr:hypothetical protein [Chryseobacterium sp. PS-8]MCF2218641.1 hypothetical protein [Chryseobacterium sp. PS-8]